MLNVIKKLLGIPFTPQEQIIEDVVRVVNGGGLWAAPPPPIPLYQTNKQSEEVPMVAEVVNNLKNDGLRNTPSGTSSLSDYFERMCGTTVTDITSTLTKPPSKIKDPLVLDHVPLKRILTKIFPWILDVTEVRKIGRAHV